jgi:hypothetical protein
MTPPARIPHSAGLLLALQRVRGGRVTVQPSGAIADQNRPFPDILVPFLRELFDHGQARLEPPGEGAMDQRAIITEAGEELFAELKDKVVDTALEQSTSDERPER